MRTFYPESTFGGFTRRDGTIAFYERVNALLSPNAVVLDVGCGRGEYSEDPVAYRRDLRILSGKCARVVGVDRDPAAEANPFLDDFRILDREQWPIQTESVDLCLIDNVLEHVEDPDLFFRESARVLRRGGITCIRTPNALGYSTLMARLLPNAAHLAVLRRVQPGRRTEDVFPTVYRCNTPRRLHSALAAQGLDAYVYGHGSEPSYLEFSPTTYALGAAWASLAPPILQNTLFAFARRPA
jgi:SAM-dependent methyltransferase